jgi:hypothetical protein
VLSSTWKVVYGVPAWLPQVVVAKDLTKVPSVWVQGRFDYTGLVVLAPQDLRDFPRDTQTVTLHGHGEQHREACAHRTGIR